MVSAADCAGRGIAQALQTISQKHLLVFDVDHVQRRDGCIGCGRRGLAGRYAAMSATHLHREIIVDNFAGGGGASTGIEAAIGRSVDIAVNHDAEAVAMHAANHPGTRHYCEDVWQIDPVAVCNGSPVGLAWFSPDCKHFSKAKGGKPVSKKIRGLAWIVVRWAKAVRPRIIMLENVEEFATWGPLGEDGKPCPIRKGFTFRRWCRSLQNLGYELDMRELRACDYGAPTSRKRLFIIARCDGQQIVWPEPTHGRGLLPYRTAADCIDWSIPCPSIFDRNKPLAEATLRRIARGIMRYVVNSANPFIVPVTHTGGDRVHSIDEPMRTITAAKRGELALVSPTLIQTGYGERKGQDPRVPGLDKPLGTIVSGGKHALVAAFLAQHNGGPHNKNISGRAADTPLSTLTGRGTQQQLVTSHLVKFKGTSRDGQSVDEPLHTVQAGGNHYGEVRSFLITYYGNDKDGGRLQDPMRTITSKERFGLVSVHGVDYQIVDIGMRMLAPHELYAAQGFPSDYIIAPAINGKTLNKTAQVRMCGNSVCPPIAEALVRANFVEKQMEVAA